MLLTADTEAGKSNNSPELFSEISVFPNPTSGYVNISFEATVKNYGSINVIDMLGNVVYSEKISIINDINRIEIDLSYLSKGIYVLNIFSDGINAKNLRITIE